MTVGAGGTLLSTTGVSIANALVLQGNTNFAGINNLTFNGNTSLPASPLTINVDAPQQTVSLLGNFIVNAGTAITKTGYGTLVLNGSYTGTVTQPTGGALSLLDDGDGYGTANTITGPSIVSTGSTVLTIGRTGVDYFPYRPLAANKTFILPSLDVAGNALTISNGNGYGISVTGPTALPTDPQIYNISTASASNLVQGLTLAGQVTGVGGIAKQGVGTLVLSNATNSFGGAGKLIDIQAGVVAASSDGALGNAANAIRLGSSGVAGSFRATGTFSTARSITLNNGTGTAGNIIEVTAGNTLTLTSPFVGTSGTTQLIKNDNGTLVLAAANPTSWTGSITAASGSVQVLTGGVLVNAGTVRIADAGAAARLLISSPSTTVARRTVAVRLYKSAAASTSRMRSS
ncbi:MAG: hypothetical protein QM811_31615 [Pirellulales bacterium]